MVPMLPASSMSLLVYGAVENYRKNPSQTISKYLSMVLTYILHGQVSPKALITLTEELNILSQNYIQSWREHQPSSISKKLFQPDNILSTFNKILLNCSDYKVGIEASKLRIRFGDSANCYQLTAFEAKALFRMSIFYLVQLSQENRIDSQRIAEYTKILLVLLKISNEFTAGDTSKNCIKYIFQHPILLQHFEPIFTDSNSTQNQITKLIIEVLEDFNISENELLTAGILHSFQAKFVKQIKSFVHKNKDNAIDPNLKVHLELIRLLQLNKETIVDLMTKIMILKKEKFIVTNKSELSIWGTIIPELVKQFSSKIIYNESKSMITLNSQLLNKVITFSIALKTRCNNITTWENSLFDYLHILPHSISVIDGSKSMTDLYLLTIYIPLFNDEYNNLQFEFTFHRYIHVFLKK